MRAPLDVGRQHALDQIEAAGFEVGQAHGGVDDRQVDDAVDVDVVLVPVVGEFFQTMRSCGTRSTNLKGPAHTGCRPNLSPSASAALGDTIMPARSVSWASSGENGALRHDVDRQRVDHLDVSIGADSGLRTNPHGVVAVEAVLGGCGVELFAVMELARPDAA